MKIIVTTHDSLAPIRGGGAIRTLKCAEEFQRLGHNVIIIAPTDGINKVRGIRTHWLHAPKKQRSQILSSLKFNIRLMRKFIQAMPADVVFSHNTLSAATLPFLKRFYHFRFCLDLTDIHAEYLPIGRRNIIEQLLTPLLMKVEYWIIRSADRITVVSSAMKELLVHKGISEGKINVVYDGVDAPGMDRSKEVGSQRNVLHLGSVDRQHGIHYLVMAAREVLNDYPRTRFFIVGGGRELARIKKLAQSLGVFGNFVFTGQLECSLARTYLRMADTGIIPRENNTPNKIITTLKLYEYWASSTAVISSRLDGIAEIASDGEDILFFRSGDYMDLAAKIKSLIASPETLLKLKKRGLQTVKKFEWKLLVPKIVSHALS